MIATQKPPLERGGATRLGEFVGKPSAAAFLLQHFDRLAEAPGGLAKLRALILQLGVQGKLLPQNPTDEAAATLIERVQAEKKRMRAAKLIPPERGHPAFDEHELPFAIPPS